MATLFKEDVKKKISKKKCYIWYYRSNSYWICVVILLDLYNQMLQNPKEFSTAVQALLAAKQQSISSGQCLNRESKGAYCECPLFL